ncbi:unnamed protein product [Spirodela intermedia]|uniref:PHD-type zinc finger plants domain-containing protein n=2 Tax=Spirodela intermedia TaxID=51605 RepID=A0A7I8J9P3_SPIIN|nr:unnamed protein product [Spirodela intermedia]CAA6666800.1 unnamed protein product [Spirodela intermedia]CAA7403604.1 unnamed protein product [Spirodela intermedia]
MVDLNTVCCMCGDVGFPDKLFRCARCFSRFQHSYCSNYYEDTSEAVGFCDWCRSDERKSSRKQKGAQTKKSSVGKDQAALTGYQADHPGDEKAKQDGGSYREDGGSARGKSTSGAGPSTRPSGRRYKLLKDVLC